LIFVPFIPSNEGAPQQPSSSGPSASGTPPGLNPQGIPGLVTLPPIVGIFAGGGPLLWSFLALDLCALIGLVVLLPRVLSKLVDE
jgi:hypothetical protein